MKIAIYTRKSKYSDKSESIDSQIEYCKQTAKMRYPDVDDFIVYVDEGFSGGTTERPQYQRMLLDIKQGKDYTAVLCYKIDRISRSLADFTNLQQYLEKQNVHIISASEGFDTSTVWGVAVLNILMIFAQLERSNTSERIRDTMLHYARQGRWTGGLTPTGFESKSIPYTDSFGQEKNMVILSPIPEEIETIKTIYSKYRELNSLNAVETYLIQNDVKTKKNKNYSVSSIRDILINPVYAVADERVYDFFSEKGSEICNDKADFNGDYSILSYNREDKKKLVTRPVEEWIIAISKHRGTIPGSDWVYVQRQLEVNSDKKPRLGTAQYGIFSGMITCARCGSTMRIKNGRISAGDGHQEFYYICNLKEISKKTKCDMKNLIGHTVENQILEKIEEYAKNDNLFDELARKNGIRLSTELDERKNTLDRLNAERQNKQNAVDNLVEQLSKISDANAVQIIAGKIGSFGKEVDELNQKIAILELELTKEKSRELDLYSLKELFSQVRSISLITDVKAKRNLIRRVITKMEWDGRKLTIYFKTGDKINFNEAIGRGDFKLQKMQTLYSHGFSLDQNKRISVKSGATTAFAEQIRADNQVGAD